MFVFKDHELTLKIKKSGLEDCGSDYIPVYLIGSDQDPFQKISKSRNPGFSRKQTFNEISETELVV